MTPLPELPYTELRQVWENEIFVKSFDEEVPSFEEWFDDRSRRITSFVIVRFPDPKPNDVLTWICQTDGETVTQLQDHCLRHHTHTVEAFMGPVKPKWPWLRRAHA